MSADGETASWCRIHAVFELKKEILSSSPREAREGRGNGMTTFDQQVEAAKQWFASPRFAGIVRLYSPREVAEQQGTISSDCTVARRAAEEFYARLRELFEQRKQITT